MSKKKSQRSKQHIVPPQSARKKYLTLAATGLMVTLCLGTVLGPWRNSLGARKLRSLFAAPAPPPPIPPANNPSKEYIYAGGKLVATEEPQPLAAPLNLAANTVSGSQVNVTWAASSGADHYEVERASNITSGYTIVAPSVIGTSFTETGFSSVATYLYRVRAIGSSGNSSPPSNIDIATTITFSDDPLTAGSTPVKAQHLTELRQAVDAVRATANLSPAGWTDSALSGVVIKAIHIQELRTNLDQARSALGMTLDQYTDSSLSGIAIKKVHIEEIRERVK
jgi:fibronectin type III domain protein